MVILVKVVVSVGEVVVCFDMDFWVWFFFKKNNNEYISFVFVFFILKFWWLEKLFYFIIENNLFDRFGYLG